MRGAGALLITLRNIQALSQSWDKVGRMSIDVSNVSQIIFIVKIADPRAAAPFFIVIT